MGLNPHLDGTKAKVPVGRGAEVVRLSAGSISTWKTV